MHRACLRPGEANASRIWNTYVKPLVDPFVGDSNEHRYCDEDEFHELIWDTWCQAGVDNDVTIEHESKLSEGSSAVRGSRIDFRFYYDDLYRVEVEVKPRAGGRRSRCKNSSCATPRPARSIRCWC
ncbi:hypothetical protein B7C42_08188 [Nocardia cerradoensis]|uniref:Uncharacterized protein n=1 Tax=Nocardia cerradoensis TaxID=85688 RepID=A0A231GT30_9NOCA|nr:hypothetical protein B7C42_08188 [Nocardia cerradoensis]